ncbi:hypothetical protein HDU78_003455 [Chytriomyces hyalinus]|nr:hypothetical protein HDU78_003455 [Chytriomyces hyalinus]KAJ3263423.1 hypothetical protein HDU77_010717 [Chytriomyces hyalinus]
MSNPPRSQPTTTQPTTATLNLQRQQQPAPPHPNVTLVQKPPALSLSAADQIAHALATSNSTYALAKVHFDPLAASIRRVVEVDRTKQQSMGGNSLSGGAGNAAQFRFDDSSSSSSSSSSSGVVYSNGGGASGRFNMGVPNVNNLNTLNSTAKLHATNTQTSKLI